MSKGEWKTAELGRFKCECGLRYLVTFQYCVVSDKLWFMDGRLVKKDEERTCGTCDFRGHRTGDYYNCWRYHDGRELYCVEYKTKACGKYEEWEG